MTNADKIMEKFNSDIKSLAEVLIRMDSVRDEYGEYYTSDDLLFDDFEKAVEHEIEWLKSEVHHE